MIYLLSKILKSILLPSVCLCINLHERLPYLQVPRAELYRTRELEVQIIRRKNSVVTVIPRIFYSLIDEA